jgi:hypothetical protein
MRANGVRQLYHNSLGYRGVFKDGRKFGAQIKIAGKRKFLGKFATIEQAARAYDKAAMDLHGDLAVLNFPE